MLDTRWRAGVERGLRPAGARLRQVGISADQITLLGLAASVACGLVIAAGRLGWGAFFLALSGLTDVLDGAVAKSGGTAGPRGAFFDSVCDRVSDGVVLGGAAWYYAGREAHLAVLAFGVALLSLLVSYERSRAESLGFNGKGGLMERAERMVVLGVGLTFGFLTAALWVLLVLTGFTVVQRFLLVWRQATPAAQRQARPSWWVTARDARSDESRLAGWWSAARPPGERSRLANWLLTARPPSGEGDRRWWTSSRPARPSRWSRSGEARGFDGVARDDIAGVRSQLRRLRSRTRP
jgi:CDP-diacylglycerol--glycerol-3-phosphate 3-phosphatidyltransferase